MLSTLVLFSCAKAPEELTKRSYSSQSTTQSSASTKQDNIETRLDPLKNIFSTIPSIKNNTYDNLTFNGDITITQPEEIGLLSFKQTQDFTKNKTKAIKNFLKKITMPVPK